MTADPSTALRDPDYLRSGILTLCGQKARVEAIVFLDATILDLWAVYYGLIVSFVAVCVPDEGIFLLHLLFAIITAVMDTAENVIANIFFSFVFFIWHLLECTINKQTF